MMIQHIKYVLFSLFFVSIVIQGFGQNKLTLQQAISEALQNNFNILLAQNTDVINHTNNTLGNAGFLPELSLGAGQNYNISNTKQELFSGEVRQGSGVNSNNLNANLQLAWTLFDGKKMFINRDKLNTIENIGKLNIQWQMENTVSQVMAAFYNIDQQQKRIDVIKKAIDISKERWSLANVKKNLGSGNGIDVLQAQVDINADSSALIRQILIVKNAKIQLNELLGREPALDFEVEGAEVESFTPELQDLEESAQRKNTLLQLADKNIANADLSVKQFEANKYPSIDLNLGYNLTKSQTEIGLLKYNQNAGLAYGLTGKWNIFNGWNNKREIQVAKLNKETYEIMKEQTALSLRTDIMTAYNNYFTAKELETIEAKNAILADKNLQITTEKMKLGSTNSLELRQAQLNVVDVSFRKITAAFDAHLAKIELLRLSGSLVK